MRLLSGHKKEENVEIPDKFFDKEEKISVKEKLENKYSIVNISSKEKVVVSLIFLLVIHILALIGRYLYCFIYLDRFIISNNIIYLAFATLLPILLWIYATDTKLFEIYRPKRRLYIAVVINDVLTICQPLYTLLWKIAVTKIFSLTPNASMTKELILNTARVVTGIGTSAIIALVFKIIYPIFLTKEALEKIQTFELKEHMETRENAENLYDLVIAKDLETGEKIIVREKDRQMHTLANGASGTGKTSSVIIPTVNNDIKIKCRNKELREKEELKFVLADKGYISKDYKAGMDFDEDFIIPHKGYEKELEKIKTKYNDCGMTIIAPDNSHFEPILKLAKANGLKVNCFDPTRKYEDDFDNAKDVGLQPFYVPYDLDEDKRVQIIQQNAKDFADVMIAVNEQEATMESYFRDINKSVTMNVAIVVMLYKNLNHEQASVSDVHNCIDFPQMLEEYVDFIEQSFGIVVLTSQKSKKQNVRANHDYSADNLHKSEEDLLKEERIANLNSADAKNNPYYHVLLFVKTELLGDGSEKMFDQARGLRNLIANFFMTTQVRDILSSDENHTLYLDKALSKNEITLVNTAMSISSTVSTGLGIFYLLLLKAASFRRPGQEDTRSLHFLFIDEATQYMGPHYDDMLNVLRKYRVCVTWALQSLAQFSKTNVSKYIGNMIQNVGTQYVFGRVASEDMKLYEHLAGIEKVYQKQEGISHSSILDVDPGESYQERYTETTQNVLDGVNIRNRKFQEGVIFTVKDASVLKPRVCKFSFVPKSEFKPKHLKIVKWERFLPEEETPIEEHEEYIDVNSDIHDLVETLREDEASVVINRKTETTEHKKVIDLFSSMDEDGEENE